MMTDPISDMLTRIRNANSIERPLAEMPASKLKVAIAQVLKEEGFIIDYHVGTYVKGAGGAMEFNPSGTLQDVKPILRIHLKFGPDGEKVIRHIARASKPGRRYYQASKEIRRVLDGLGISILTTSKGVMSNRQARRQNVGGEVLCVVW